jgi:hypothetical protein
MAQAPIPVPASDYPQIRRFPRHKVDIPIRVIVCNAMKSSIFDGRGTSLSHGGMAMFAGTELRLGDHVAVEFTPPTARRRFG